MYNSTKHVWSFCDQSLTLEFHLEIKIQRNQKNLSIIFFIRKISDPDPFVSFKIRICAVLCFCKPHTVPLFLIAQPCVTVLQSNFMTLTLRVKDKLLMKYGSLTQSQTFNLHWTIFSATELFILCNNISNCGKYLQYLSKCFKGVCQIK